MLIVKVLLCPHISDHDLFIGHLDKDECIRNITNNPIDSRNAYCSFNSDKQSIHKAILSKSPNAFDDMNVSVEMIRLWYLLFYPIYKICNPGPDFFYESGISSRYITVLVYSLIVGLVAFLFGFHLGIIVFPLVGLLSNYLVRHIDHEGLTSRWENYTEGRTFGRNIFHWIIYPFVMILWYLMDRDDVRRYKKDAVQTLANAIMVVVKRAHSLGDDDVPSFDKHCETWGRLYDWTPIFVYRMWRNEVKRLVRKKHRKRIIKEDTKETAAENVIANNESTPLIGV